MQKAEELLEKMGNFLIGNDRPLHDTYWVTRVWIIRGLGLIYFVAFSIIFTQGSALWGDKGLLPISAFISVVEKHFANESAFWNLPSLFYFISPEASLKIFGVVGIFGGLVMMAGYANFFLLFVLWCLQLSFVNSGQLFYGYGWETQLLEFTFLSFFLVPLVKPNLRSANFQTPRITIWAMRWMLFRLMLGAGLIKIRGDDCWRDLTCLIYHYETQPNPHPLSYFFHQMPALFHNVGTLFNHFVELIVPFGFFGPKRIRRWAGLLTVIFQVTLIISGNLAWLNWLTLLMAIPCFDDEFFGRFQKLRTFSRSMRFEKIQAVILGAFAVVIIYLSAGPALNLVSSNQAMNTSYDQWHILNSYGAFGSIGKQRNEVIISGSQDQVEWKEYQLHCAPGDIKKRPCLITPYHYHLDWQIWFSGMRSQLEEKWLFALAVRLLENNRQVADLFSATPFGDQPPKYLKMDLYHYRFADWKDWPEKWWTRTFIQSYLPPISLEDESVKNFRSTSP